MKKKTSKDRRPVIIQVEDDEHVSYLISFILERNGYEAITVNDGYEFFKLLDNDEVPDLIILDVMLPYFDGFELVKFVRKEKGWTEVPIIILSSLRREDDIVHAFEAGASDYITKPFQPMELIARVEHLLAIKDERSKSG